MYERTNMAKDFLQTMPTHEKDSDVSYYENSC